MYHRIFELSQLAQATVYVRNSNIDAFDKMVSVIYTDSMDGKWGISMSKYRLIQRLG